MANRFQKWQIDMLKLAFQESRYLTKEKKLELVGVTGLDMEQVSSWFNRMRSRKRSMESKEDLEQINAELKKLIKISQQREADLQKELEEVRRWEAEIQAENQSLKRRIAIAEGDICFDPLMKFIKGSSYDI